MPDLLHRVTSPRPVKSLLIFRPVMWEGFLPPRISRTRPGDKYSRKILVTTTINPRGGIAGGGPSYPASLASPPSPMTSPS